MRFVATLNDGSFVNVRADRMEAFDNMLYVYSGEQMVALVEVTAVICAHLSERGDEKK